METGRDRVGNCCFSVQAAGKHRNWAPGLHEELGGFPEETRLRPKMGRATVSWTRVTGAGLSTGTDCVKARRPKKACTLCKKLGFCWARALSQLPRQFLQSQFPVGKPGITSVPHTNPDL